ncbi:MAG: HlyD family type I secretion periplasmic adaptor subunit [Magnetococcales bacterium]|nr:HlyD family type I secretion periplasmic adaptor subunit [Magnetococcales bacterium]
MESADTAPPVNRLRQLFSRLTHWKPWARKDQRVMADAVPFLNDLDEIMEERPPAMLRSIHYIILTLFLSMLLIATLVEVNVVVVGMGRLITLEPPIMLQPIERAIVRELNAKVGDVVTKGQRLATLDPTFTRANVATLVHQQRTLQTQTSRLESELNGLPYLGGGHADDQLQINLFNQRKEQFQSRMQVYDEDILKIRSNIRALEEQKKSLEEHIKVIKEVETMRLTLMQADKGSKLLYLQSQGDRIRIEREMSDASNRLKTLHHELASKQAEQKTYRDEWQRQILEQLVGLRNELAKIDQELNKANLMNDLVEVISPVDGVILEVAKRSVGSILREAEPLITIVPMDAKLVGEITIASGDVGYTKVGNKVVGKVDAFSYQRHGFLHGELQWISEDSYPLGSTGGQEAQPLVKGGGGAFHRARIDFGDSRLHNLPEGARLIPGMTMTADIEVGSRSIISFFLYPITRSLGESLREP